MATDNRGPQVAGVAYFFLPVTTIAVGLRIYTRVRLQKAFGLDDYLCAAAQVFFMLYSIFSIMGVQHGTGQHTVDIPAADLPIALRNWWACEPLYVLTGMCLKASIGVFLLRLCVAPVQRYMIYFVVGLTQICSTIFFFIFIFQCSPTSYFWGRLAPVPETGSCIDASITINTFYAYSAIACLTDWTLALLPILLVKDLQMNKQTKWSVALILSAGAIASSATIIRIPYIHGMTDALDFLYSTVDVAIWSTAETGIGITASALATLRPLFRNFYNKTKMFGTTTPDAQSSRWPQSGAGFNSGYVRSQNITTKDKIELRKDINSQNGTTTRIAADAESGKGEGYELNRSDSQGQLKDTKNGWTPSSARTSDDISDEFDSAGKRFDSAWGIRKTVNIQVHHQDV